MKGLMYVAAILLGALVVLSVGHDVEELKKIGQNINSHVKFVGKALQQGQAEGQLARSAGSKAQCPGRPWWLSWQGAPARWTKLNKNLVCFGARDSKYGRFTYGQSAFIWEFKVEHVRGRVTCNKKDYSNFGCRDNDNIGVFITDVYNRIVVPIGVNTKFYTMNGFEANSKALVFTSGESPVGIHKTTELRVWYGEDLYDSTESDNGGASCVNVYGLI